MSHRQKIGLQDCRNHGFDGHSELFIVEGMSASQAVCNLRDPEFQAVLPMQGKPANASKASPRLLGENNLFRDLSIALGFTAPAKASVEACRYSRILFLFDPDADGIHCGALMLIYFYHQLRLLLDAGLISVVRAPLFQLTFRQTLLEDAPTESRYAYTEEEVKQLQRELTLAGVMNLKTQRMRGLGGMPTDILRSKCIDPKTRDAFRLGAQDAEAALAAFGG